MLDANESVQKIPVNPSDVCYRAFELMQAKSYDEAEKLLNNAMSKVDDNVAIALFHSSLGVLFKLKGEPKTAWRHYERAEKLMPEDAALKIIMSRLLIDQFAEYDQAIKKMKKALGFVNENPVFIHQVYITMGLAYLGKGMKQKSIEMLKRSMENNFVGFVTAQNIDFNLTEALLRKGFALDECRTFLEKAYAFARDRSESVWIELIDRMLKAFPE